MVNDGKFKNQLAESRTVAMSLAEQPQGEIIIPAYGDIYALELTLSNTMTGTPTGAKTIDYSFKTVTVKDRNGQLLLQNIRGNDLLFLERFRNKGISRTVPTATTSATTETFLIPLNVEKASTEAKVSVSIAPYSDLATSGWTAGSVTYSSNVWYYDRTEEIHTEKIQRITKTVNSGTNTFGIDLPKGIIIKNILFKIGTEANISSITFTGDGNKEMDVVYPQHLVGIDKCMLVSGHITGEFSLYNAPFFSTAASRFDVLGASADTMEIFVVSEM